MTYRAIILVPEGLTFEQLTEEQQAACNSVFGQYINPMPSTVPFNGKQVLDGLAADNFDPTTIGTLGLPFEIIGLYHDASEAPVIPLNETVFMNYLQAYTDEQGNPINPTFHVPHSWAGWKEL
ncbi:MAG: hypothetical protein IAE63_06735 [Alphaproteobacteria bacterium]|nr:hypothetical protein [Alphaproteobacteria bacterium]